MWDLFQSLLNFCSLVKQSTFWMVALKNRQGHAGVQWICCASGFGIFSVYISWGRPAMKILLISEFQNTETVLICFLWSEGQEGVELFSLLALWISAFSPFYFSGLLNDQNRHSPNHEKQVPICRAVVISSICCYLFIKVHPLKKKRSNKSAFVYWLYIQVFQIYRTHLP